MRGWQQLGGGRMAQQLQMVGHACLQHQQSRQLLQHVYVKVKTVVWLTYKNPSTKQPSVSFEPTLAGMPSSPHHHCPILDIKHAARPLLFICIHTNMLIMSLTKSILSMIAIGHHYLLAKLLRTWMLLMAILIKLDSGWTRNIGRSEIYWQAVAAYSEAAINDWLVLNAPTFLLLSLCFVHPNIVFRRTHYHDTHIHAPAHANAHRPTLTADELDVRFQLIQQLGIREIDIWSEINMVRARLKCYVLFISNTKSGVLGSWSASGPGLMFESGGWEKSSWSGEVWGANGLEINSLSICVHTSVCTNYIQFFEFGLL